MPPGPITRPLLRDTLLHSQRPAARRSANRVKRPSLPQTNVPVMAAIRPVGEPGRESQSARGPTSRIADGWAGDRSAGATRRAVDVMAGNAKIAIVGRAWGSPAHGTAD